MDYYSKENETVDEIVWRYYGSTAEEQVERVLAHNVGLAVHGAVLPMNTLVVLPELESEATEQGEQEVSLWD